MPTGNPPKEKCPARFTTVRSLVRNTGFLAELHIELMTKSNTCMTNSPVTGPSFRAVMGASLTDVTGVLRNPRGVTTAELTNR